MFNLWRPTVTTPDLDALRELAEKATPGGWRVGFNDGSGKGEGSEGCWVSTVDEDEQTVVRGGREDWGVPVGVPNAADARFIAAANPQAILSLLDEIDRLRAALEEMRVAFEEPGAETLEVLDVVGKVLAVALDAQVMGDTP